MYYIHQTNQVNFRNKCHDDSTTNIVPSKVKVKVNVDLYTVFQKKTSTHIIGYKLRNSCPILIIFDIKIPHII